MVTRPQLDARDEAQAKSAAESANAAQAAQAAQAAIDDLKQELFVLEGRLQKLEDLQKRQQAKWDSTLDPLKESQKKVDQQLEGIEKKTTGYETTIAELQAQVTALSEKIQELNTLAENPALLVQGRAQFKANRFEEAIQTLTQYLKANQPKGLADALFLRAQAYFKLKQYRKAIVDYSKFYETFPKSNYIPEVLFRTGKSFEALHMKEDAKGFFQELLEKHPHSSFAKQLKR
jgi:TolA-binding protein